MCEKADQCMARHSVVSVSNQCSGAGMDIIATEDIETRYEKMLRGECDAAELAMLMMTAIRQRDIEKESAPCPHSVNYSPKCALWGGCKCWKQPAQERGESGEN